MLNKCSGGTSEQSEGIAAKGVASANKAKKRYSTAP